MSLTLEDIAMLMVIGDGLISDDEVLLLLLDMFESENTDDGHKQYPPFNLENYNDKQCRDHFRFDKCDILRLADVLGLEEEYSNEIRIKWGKIEGLCILLKRLVYPNRLTDIIWMFGRHKCVLSSIVNIMLEDVYIKHGDRLLTLNQQWLHVNEFADTVLQKCGMVGDVWGFLDGTLKGICRPQHLQELAYSGHKRKHGLKYQSLMTPCGLIAHVFGPVEGRRHDSAMYYESDLDQQLQGIYAATNKVIYGDSAYCFRPYLWAPFKGNRLTQDQSDFNDIMKPVRESVEWGFGKISTLFAFVDYHKNQKIYLQPVGKYYLVAALMTNAHTCLYSSQVCTFFNCLPPPLENYFS
jgi:hypothetical protein